MTYNPATDFLALWRNISGQVSKVEMPGLDYVVAALARAGLLTLSTGATAPVVSQSTTAWLHTAVPSNSAEGALFLWNPATSAYVAATPGLLLLTLQANAGQSGVSWYPTTGGPPANTVGVNGDFAIRTDNPGGIYGPKTLGAWPASPLPGTSAILSSQELDNTFGNTPGQILYRSAAEWQGLPVGSSGYVLSALSGEPVWDQLTTLLDLVFGTGQGSIIYRDAAAWEALPPGTAGGVLTTFGPNADPAWEPLEVPVQIPSGSVMLFQQSAAPVGWTKITAFSDYALRVVSGAVGSHGGSGMSSVFAQTAVANTTITQATSPSHFHGFTGTTGGNTANGSGNPQLSQTGASTGSIGGDQAHTHSINLNLAYVDVILASKD